MTRWHGVVELVQDAVDHGTIGVERVHLRVARAPFDLAARLPPLAPVARRLGDAQARIIAATYGSIRDVNEVVAPLVAAVIDHVARARTPSTEPPEADSSPR